MILMRYNWFVFQCDFQFTHLDYEEQLLRLRNGKEKPGLIINNPEQTMFLFVDRHVKSVGYNFFYFFLYLTMAVFLVD